MPDSARSELARKVGHPGPGLQAWEPGIPASGKPCALHPTGWPQKQGEVAPRALDLGSSLVLAPTSWATSALSFSIRPTQTDNSESSGVKRPALGGGAGRGHVEGHPVPPQPRPTPPPHSGPSSQSLSGAGSAEPA